MGQRVEYTDRNGTVHQYEYDVLGRLSVDRITQLGANVDGAIRRIEYFYDGQGNLFTITAFDAPVGGNIVNQVKREYNGLGQLTDEWQSHSGVLVQRFFGDQKCSKLRPHRANDLCSAQTTDADDMRQRTKVRLQAATR